MKTVTFEVSNASGTAIDTGDLAEELVITEPSQIRLGLSPGDI